jgi:tetratricopeptide (TPR) repeat protein
MSNSALIEDLERQFSENPRRVFARLANEYRKSGNLDGAIALCREHVPKHPGYISGHIVLGQALFDTGSLGDARQSFEAALQLDPENLIALRHLGDIARQGGDLEEARSWYRRLLEVDPQNEDAAAQLDIMDVGSLPTPIVALPAIAPETDTETDEEPGLALAPEPISWSDINPESGSYEAISGALASREHASEHAPEHAADVLASSDHPADATSPGLGDEQEAEDGELLSLSEVGFGRSEALDDEGESAYASGRAISDVALDFEFTEPSSPLVGMSASDGSDNASAAAGDGVSTREEVDLDREFAELATLPSVGHFAPGEILQEMSPFEETVGRSTPVAFEMPEEDVVTLTDELAVPESLAREASLSWAAKAEADADSSGDIASGSPLDHSEASEMDAVPFGEDDHGDLDVLVPDAEPAPAFVTETVAELYERQGHLTQSLEVYRQLAEQNPGNEALRLHVERLEAELHSNGASGLAGENVRAFLGRVLQRRAPQRTRAGGSNGLFPGAHIATEEEQAARALSAAFSPGPTASESGRPARAADDELSLASVFRDQREGRRPPSGEVSFDEFFPDAEALPSEPPADAERPAAGPPSGEDERFHNWLDGLKR